MSEHYDRCKARVLDHVDCLVERVRHGQVNASALEALIDSFLSQPAFQDYRLRLRDVALTRVDGRERHDR